MTIRWDSQALADLGKVPDTVIARRLGVSHRSVSRHRQKLGIASFDRHNTTLLDIQQRGTHDWGRQPLGQMSDNTLAAKLGVSRQRIHVVRKRLGIPSFTESQKTEDSFSDWLAKDEPAAERLLRQRERAWEEADRYKRALGLRIGEVVPDCELPDAGES